MKTTCALIVFLLLMLNLGAQQETPAPDTTGSAKKKIYRGPRTASLLSAVLPGAGQVYNRKYWKLPIIYAGMGGLGYLFYVHNADYRYFRQNLSAIHDKDSSTENVTPYSSEQLITLKNDSRKLRDLAVFGAGLVYLLNIVDANVDAHLKTFDVSDDLTMQLGPAFMTGPYLLSGGIKLKLIIN